MQLQGAGENPDDIVIVPSILPVLSLSLLLAVRGSLSVFEIPYIMTGGANGSSTFVIQTVDMAFKLVISAGIVLAIIPSLIVFLALQKYIYSGLTQGAVKG